MMMNVDVCDPASVMIMTTTTTMMVMMINVDVRDPGLRPDRHDPVNVMMMMMMMMMSVIMMMMMCGPG